MSATKFNAYLVRNVLDLYSNFTYFLDNPVDGDQFSQPDRRVSFGANLSHTWQISGLGQEAELTAGAQLQNDNIFNGLYNTKARQRLSTTREDHITESSLGLYLDHATRWNSYFRSIVGLRLDHYRFKVNSDLAVNSGSHAASIVSPKLNLVFGPWQSTEWYFNLGRGFHSNDARGTSLTRDPKTGEATEPVSPLVRSTGVEVGVRTMLLPGLQTSLSLYRLDFASELLFVGDAGTTEASRPSRRIGFEFSNYYKPNDWLTIDADISFAKARFKDSDPVGQRIPGAVEGVASLALAVDNLGPYFGALQWRYFGARPLIESNEVRSRATSTINARIGYKVSKGLRVELEGFNLANRKDSAIDYFYTSRLPNEAADGVADRHFHPIESRSLRLTLVGSF